MASNLVAFRRHVSNDTLSLLAGGTLPGAVELRREMPRERAAFTDELGERNHALLFWSIAIVNIFCIAWIRLDRLLAATLRSFFASGSSPRLRLVLDRVRDHRPRLGRRTGEAWWLCAVCYGTFIAAAVPLTGKELNAFVLGYVLIILTVAFLLLALYRAKREGRNWVLAEPTAAIIPDATACR